MESLHGGGMSRNTRFVIILSGVFTLDIVTKNSVREDSQGDEVVRVLSMPCTSARLG